MRVVYIVIGCDTDPDRAGLVGRVEDGSLSWRGLTEGIPHLKESVHGLSDDRGTDPVFTWLLRVDEQVRVIHGSYSWVLEAHGEMLQQLELSGDELGWHPHFWRYNSEASFWSQDAEDIAWQVDMLREAHKSFMNIFPGRAKSVRMGWDYHNNETFQTLEQLGVRVDFSAIPGLRTLSASHHNLRENLFDWFATPRRPYLPSRQDYRRPAEANEDATTVVEAPNFTSSSFVWGLASGLQFARKMKSIKQLTQAIRRPTYWINITGRPKLFNPLLSQLRRDLRGTGDETMFFVTYFHPDELLANKSSLYDLVSVRINLERIIQTCRAEATKVEFIRAVEIPRLTLHGS